MAHLSLSRARVLACRRALPAVFTLYRSRATVQSSAWHRSEHIVRSRAKRKTGELPSHFLKKRREKEEINKVLLKVRKDYSVSVSVPYFLRAERKYRIFARRSADLSYLPPTLEDFSARVLEREANISPTVRGYTHKAKEREKPIGERERERTHAQYFGEKGGETLSLTLREIDEGAYVTLPSVIQC